MCGRFVQPGSRIADELSAVTSGVYEPRFNVAPTQDAAVVRLGPDGRRRLELLRWGLVPAWANDIGVGSTMINARSETVSSKPAFRDLMSERRCLVPAQAFYEWKRDGSVKQPYCFRMFSEQPFAMAGLWTRWQSREQSVESFTILTTTPNTLVEQFHDRMPVILLPGDYDRWLDPHVSAVESLSPMFRPVDANLMDAFPVSRRVNSVRHDDAALMDRVRIQTQQELF